MKIKASAEPAVYVGTYKKYNEGSLAGKWMKLDDYASKEDFLEAARKLHKDEEDPELMFQDYEGFPKSYYHESSIPDELWDWLKLSSDDRDMLEAYTDAVGEHYATFKDAEDNFLGKYDSPKDFAMSWVDEHGLSHPEYYAEMTETDKRVLASDIVDSKLEDLSEDEMLEQAEMKDEYDALEEQLDEAGPEEIKTIKQKMEKLISDASDKLTHDRYEEIIKELDDPVGYFVEREGLYSVEELMKQPWVTFNYDAIVRDMGINDVHFAEHGGEVYVFSRS